MNDYVTRILANVGDRSPVESLQATRHAIESAAHAIEAKGNLGVSYAPGKWTAREVICHLADIEIAIGFRMRHVIASDNVVVQPFDEQAWARNYAHGDAGLALSSFLALRAWNLAFLEALPAAAWDKPYRHPDQGDLTFSVLIRLLAGHDINHLNQLKTISRDGGR